MAMSRYLADRIKAREGFELVIEVSGSHTLFQMTMAGGITELSATILPSLDTHTHMHTHTHAHTHTRMHFFCLLIL